MGGGVVDHGEAFGADLPGDGGGEEGLPQPRVPGEEQVPAPRAEGGGVALAGPVNPVHILPGGDSQGRVLRLAVPLQGEGLKALVP